MKTRTIFLAATSGLLLNLGPAPAFAEHSHSSVRPDSHAPAGVMADHIHKAGEWMFSYRYMNMLMQDNAIDENNVSPEQIVTTVANPFAGQPMQPPTLRVVPTDMRMEMHMLGAMYAPNDHFTLMLMLPYATRTMNHITFQGGMGTTRLGSFQTQSSGLGDVKVRGLFAVDHSASRSTHASFGISLPTGSIAATDRILTPMGATPTPRLPYPMQVGSGTYDLLPGLTHSGHAGIWGWGAQYEGQIRLGRNNEDYSFGDTHVISAWASVQPASMMSLSLRVRGQNQATIDGSDAQIIAPVQTADPDHHGGDRVDIGAGINLAGQGRLRGHRLSVEWLEPVYQNLNGPQLEVRQVLSAGYQYAF